MSTFSFKMGTFAKCAFLLSILLLNCELSICQVNEKQYDSLVSLTKSPVDTIKLNALKKLTWECRLTKPLQAFEFGFDGLEIAEKLKQFADIAELHNYIGVIAIKVSTFDKAKIHVQIAKKISENINLPEQKAYAINNLGDIYNKTGKSDSAIILLTEAIKIFKSINNLRGLAYAYNQIGLTLCSQKKYDDAIHYHKLALEIREKQDYKLAILASNYNLGLDYLGKGQFLIARNYFEKMGVLVRQVQPDFSAASYLIYIGKTYQGENNSSVAIKYYKWGYRLADSAKLFIDKRDAAYELSKIYNLQNDCKTALAYFQIYKTMDDSVKSSNLNAEYKQLEMKIMFGQKYKYMEFKLQQDIDKNNIKLYWNKILINSFIAFFVVLLTFIIILAFSFKTIAKKNKQLLLQKVDIENKNQELYAQNQHISNQSEAIMQQRDELEIANATKDKFFSIIGHDLRGPIGNIQTFFNLVVEHYKDEIDPQLMKIFSSVNASAQQTYALLDNLLTWARSQRGTLDFIPLKNNLFIVVENNLHLLQAKASEKKITISNLLPKELICEFDFYMIDTVIRNLLSNAIKFTNIDGKINVEGKINSDMSEISVIDTGIGISQEIIDDLFKIDIKHNTYVGTNGEKGTGLGLILCYEFIEKHKGKIWAESELNVGSKFIFTLPIKQS